MAGSFRSALSALAALVVFTSAASAFGGRWSSRPTGAASYAPAPDWYCCVPIMPLYCGQPVIVSPIPPAPMPKAKGLANPLPAATPTTKEPPLRAPAITESRSLGGVMPAQAIDVAAGRCKVGFWNITGADVTLTIDGKSRQLPKDRAVTLELDRSFVWQIDDRNPRSERVPDGQILFEVILRPRNE